ncbi:MAG: non-ribosomal peptide synthetase [Acidobacteriota bacterium]
MSHSPFSRLTPAQELFVREWNDTRTEYPRDETIAGLFEEVVRDHPASPALVSAADGRSLSYDDLNRRANRLAHHFKRVGLGEGALVAIQLERSFDMIVAMLAALKAGCGYVPLDPRLPLKRISRLLEDARPAMVVTVEELSDALPASTRLVCLDTDARAITRESDANPARAGSALAVAHVLYTSGSTGEPKGVAVVNRGVIRLVRGTSYAAFGAGETFLQAAPVSFDASTFEIWGALLHGARLVLLPPGAAGLDEIVGAVRDHAVTTLWLTAGLFHLVVEERLAGLRDLRTLLAGGDVLSPARVREARRGLPECALVNGYGPTESTTFAACHRVQDLPAGASRVPIGRPIANTRIHLLDPDGRWVPPGEPGEVFIGGDGLARGYWNRPELTAASFVEDPFAEAEGGRLYRTGDLALLRPDGELEFLGRRDEQVKVHGFRVEPGEVEAALDAHSAVLRSAVAARDAASGARSLSAWIVLRPGAACADGELRAFLQESLPDYMVPARFVRVPGLPLTENGKVDRRALPDPQPEAAAASSPPRSVLEESVSRVWSSVLGVESVDCEANFFDLGGSSLLLIAAQARLEASLGRMVPIMWLFEHPTVRTLAAAIASGSDGGARARALEERLRRRRGTAAAAAPETNP